MLEVNRVKLGLVGCGNFSDSLARALQKSQKADLITCFDINPEKGQKFSKTYGCGMENSYDSLLKRNDIDGVLLATPNAEHTDQAILAARSGKHVFVEKPIANTIDGGKKIISACNLAGVTLMVGHLRRRSAGIRKAKELIEQGVIGDPVMIEANVSSDSGFNLTPDKFRWCGDDSGCPAGALMTSGIHHVDTFNYFFGPIRSVSSYFKKLYISADVEDINMTLFEFESGVLGYLGSTYASPYDNWLYIHGTRANLLWTVPLPIPPTGKFFHNKDQYTRLILFEKGKEPQNLSFSAGDPVLEEIDEFARCVQTGERPETNGEGALMALAFIRAAIEAARSERRVRLTL
jgi:predicted dehydrogenase